MGSGNDILDMYIYETGTLLEQLETIVLDAEKADTFSQENVNEIFRIMHTIKGSSAMMEFDTLARVAHRIEDMFFIIREGTMSVVSEENRPALFDVVFQSIDYFRGEVEKVEAAAEAAAEKLYAKSEQRQSLSAGDLADLASRYNPETMGVEEYTGFLEDIVKLGVVSEEEIKSIRSYAAALPFTADILRTPTPMDGDIESWIQNRMLWKPGITRESARRAGLSDDPFAQEEKTLSTIAEILADVRRQRYPSVSL